MDCHLIQSSLHQMVVIVKSWHIVLAILVAVLAMGEVLYLLYAALSKFVCVFSIGFTIKKIKFTCECLSYGIVRFRRVYS